MASIWMHNGFLQVEGEKMSKSLGNFITVHDLLETDTFGGQRWHGRVLRYAMVQTHYRQPIDWTVERLAQARATLADFAETIGDTPAAPEPHAEFLGALADDLNTPSAISILHGLAKSAKRGNPANAAELRASLELLALWGGETRDDLRAGAAAPAIDAARVNALIEARLTARRNKDFKESDRLRDELAAMGVQLKDAKDPATGELKTTWEARG
jgi:cysteinyl-tRNA synthetase